MLAPHAALKVGLPESKCSHMLCHTRMGERWRLSKPHAVLEIGLSDGAYHPPMMPLVSGSMAVVEAKENDIQISMEYR